MQLQTAEPYAYIQQFVVKAAVVPWQPNLILMDAIRGPLGEVFALQEFISNYQFDYGYVRGLIIGAALVLRTRQPINMLS